MSCNAFSLYQTACGIGGGHHAYTPLPGGGDFYTAQKQYVPAEAAANYGTRPSLVYIPLAPVPRSGYFHQQSQESYIPPSVAYSGSPFHVAVDLNLTYLAENKKQARNHQPGNNTPPKDEKNLRQEQDELEMLLAQERRLADRVADRTMVMTHAAQ